MAIKQYDRSGTTTLSVVNDLALLVKKAKFDKENPDVVYRGKTSFTYGKGTGLSLFILNHAIRSALSFVFDKPA